MKKALIFPQFGKFGGTRTYFKNLIDFYHLNQYLIVIAIDDDSCDGDIRQFLSRPDIKIISLTKNIRTGIFSRFPSSVLYDLIMGIPILLRERPDIVLISVGAAGKFFGLMVLPFKLIYILHTSPICSKPNSFYRLLSLISLNDNKRILTVSKFSKTQILKCWLADKEQKYVEFIYNFSNLENHPAIPKDNNKKNVKKILSLGHVTEYKNLDTWYSVAVKTIEKYPGYVEFLWAGDGDLFDFYREKVKTDNIPQIKLLGFQENVVELYSQCDIYFQPSRKESHGIAVVDAMLMALPCVVSNAGGLPESVVDGKTGYVVDPDNIDEFVAKILNLLENEDLRISMGKSGKECYEKTFSYERWRQEMKRLNETIG